ncbi:hypothetical protein QE385_002835 [Sphingomonas sp. SORGH_AS 950]|nr:hypothetical protein [Sphingomonas sp. SORGH_AS_0950]
MFASAGRALRLRSVRTGWVAKAIPIPHTPFSLSEVEGQGKTRPAPSAPKTPLPDEMSKQVMPLSAPPPSRRRPGSSWADIDALPYASRDWPPASAGVVRKAASNTLPPSPYWHGSPLTGESCDMLNRFAVWERGCLRVSGVHFDFAQCERVGRQGHSHPPHSVQPERSRRPRENPSRSQCAKDAPAGRDVQASHAAISAPHHPGEGRDPVGRTLMRCPTRPATGPRPRPGWRGKEQAIGCPLPHTGMVPLPMPGKIAIPPPAPAPCRAAASDTCP